MAALQSMPLEDADLAFVDLSHGNEVALLSAVRDQSPIARTDRGYAALSYEACAELIAHSSFDTVQMHDTAALERSIYDEFLDDGLLLNMRRAQHDRIRKVMSRAFTVRRIEGSRPAMAAVAERLLDELDDPHCDFVSEFTHYYSIENISRLIGVPTEDVPYFDKATAAAFTLELDPGPELYAALETVRDYLRPLIAERRARPADDFISVFVQASDEEGLLDENELLWGIANLLLAGHDTTKYQFASCIHDLITAAPPSLWDDLGDRPELADATVAETMRFSPIVGWLERQALEPATVAGLDISSGTAFAIMIPVAGRDPRAFADPDEYRIDRTEPFVLRWGVGIHLCLGHLLARVEMIEALNVITARMQRPELAGETTYLPFGFINGPSHLPLDLHAR